MTLILGINAFHADAAAALIRDGEILGAAEEERFRRIKHWAGFPSEAIRWCLEDGGVRFEDLDQSEIDDDKAKNVLSIKSVSSHTIPPPNTTAAKNFRPPTELDKSADSQSPSQGEGYVVPEHLS
jgi:predicted NodU family carbamoyl transferase